MLPTDSEWDELDLVKNSRNLKLDYVIHFVEYNIVLSSLYDTIYSINTIIGEVVFGLPALPLRHLNIPCLCLDSGHHL